MELSLFLAKAFGLFFLVEGVALIANRKKMSAAIKSFLENEAASYLSGMVALIVGILLVISHNIWDTGWQGVISVLAWLTFLKGATRTLLPANKFRTLVEKMNMNENKYLFLGVLALVLGIYLSYIGFYF